MSRSNVTSKQSLKMGLAIKALLQLKIPFQKTSEFHLKVGDWNFWPSSGSIYRDGDPQKRPERGLDAFIKLIKSEYSDEESDDPTPTGALPIVQLDFTEMRS